jgi:RecA/RadA recombinase
MAEPRKLGGYAAKLAKAQAERRTKLKDTLEGDHIGYCGDPSLQWTMGGYSRGRLNLIWGPSKSGKSALALKWAGQEQQRVGGWVIIYDSEYYWGDDWRDNDKLVERLVKAGIDPDKTLIICSNDMNTLFTGLADLEADIASGAMKVAAILVDSWGAIMVESALGKIINDEAEDAGNSFGGNAKFIGPLIQFFLRIAGEHGVTHFFVQHCMVNMDQYGKRYLLLGGQKLRFLVHTSIFLESIEAADARMAEGDMQIGKKEVDEIVAVGKRIRAYCDKSRQQVEGRKAEFWFNFEDMYFAKPEESLFELASRIGILGHPVEPDCDDKGNPKKDKDGNPILKEKSAYWLFPSVGGTDALRWHGKPGVLEGLATKSTFDRVFAACMESKKKDAGVDVDFDKLLKPVVTEESEPKKPKGKK